MIGSRPVRLAVILLASALVLPAVPAAASRELKLTILSGRPDKVTGGDALVHVDVPDAPVRVTLNGKDVSSVFTADDGGLTGLVGNLSLGSNVLRAEAGGRRTTLEVRNYPRQGPVFSGPHEQPFVCETASFTIPVIGGTLGAPLDADCTVAPRVDYFYRTKAGQFVKWPAGATSYPADLAKTDAGDPFIVRMETTARTAPSYRRRCCTIRCVRQHRRRRDGRRAGTGARSSLSAAVVPAGGTVRVRRPVE